VFSHGHERAHFVSVPDVHESLRVCAYGQGNAPGRESRFPEDHNFALQVRRGT
jgi:hypothetical protein